MKLSIISTVALSMAVAAVPHGRRHQHQHANRRDVVVDVVTEVATQTTPVAVVYVNQAGAPQYTSWRNGGNGYHQPTTSSAPPAAPSSSTPESSKAPVSSEAPASSKSAAPPSYSAPDSSASSPPSPSASAPSGGSGAGAGASGYAISYAPYDSTGACKTADQINSDFGAFSGYSMVRIYGTDCEQVPGVLKAAASKGMKVFAGVYDIASVGPETQILIDAAKSNWDIIDTISIGNEVVNNGGSASDVVNAVKTARSMLQSAGYNGKIVTVDTFTAIIDNPELCEVSDFAAANCHAFFNADITADGAGKYVAEEAQRVKKACGGKDVMITESGWPSAGDPNGSAVPSPANQKAAVDSLRSAFSSNIVLFSAFNDAWKNDFVGSFGAEHFWGIYGNAPS